MVYVLLFFSGRKTRSMHHLASMRIPRQQRLQAQVLLQLLLRVSASFGEQQITVTFLTPHKSRYTPWKTMPGFCSSPARMLLSTYPTLLSNLPCSYFHSAVWERWKRLWEYTVLPARGSFPAINNDKVFLREHKVFKAKCLFL